MEDRSALAPVLGFITFIVIVVVVLAIRHARGKLTAEKDKKDAELKEEEGIAQGVLARDPITGEVYPRCVICGSRASTFGPVSGASWMDRLPTLNRLFGQPPRYTIVNDEENGFQYCKIHKDVAVKKLEQFHAALRAERSQFNSEQADKVAQMDAGGLHQIVIEQYKNAIEVLERRRERLAAVRMLPAAVPPDVPPAVPSTKQVLSTLITTEESEEDNPASFEARGQGN